VNSLGPWFPSTTDDPAFADPAAQGSPADPEPLGDDDDRDPVGQFAFDVDAKFRGQ
jgi:hypothetical protein